MNNPAHNADDALETVLTMLTDELGVPEGRYQEAKDHYGAVGNWLDADGSALKPYRPTIYPQGSFALGTAIRPIGDEEYDVDTVCLLRTPPIDITQQQLKRMVGDRLKEHDTYAGMIDPKDGGRRCWTLRYADASKFHLDVLPAIPEDEIVSGLVGYEKLAADTAIRITDKETWDRATEWPRSNPRGYAQWFQFRMRTVLAQSKEKRAREVKASVAAIQDYEVRTPLQRIVQLLKRHRDMRHGGDDDKPISVIITTLAAHAYNNEPTLVATLRAVVPGMRAELYRQQRGGVWWVQNPVNPAENFADKWEKAPRKAEIFLQWLDAVEAEFKALDTEEGIAGIGDYLTEAYGARDANRAMKRYADSLTSGSLVRVAVPAPTRLVQAVKALTTFEVPHRQAVPWPMLPSGAAKVEIKGEWQGAGNWKPINGPATNLVRNVNLRFRAITNVGGAYQVYWQVVNTGRDAAKRGQLRGSIFPARNPTDQKVLHEHTGYCGRHWVQCFVVQNGLCVAKSDEFIVNVV